MSGSGDDRRRDANANAKAKLIGCRKVREALPLLVSGAGAAEDIASLETHLRVCVACAREKAVLAAALAELREPVAGEELIDWEEFTRGTIERARSEAASRGGWVQRRQGTILPFPRYRIGGIFASRRLRAGVAAVGAVAVALSVSLYVGARHVPLFRPVSRPFPAPSQGPGAVGIDAAGLIKVVEALSAREQAVSALAEGRELLWGLSAAAEGTGGRADLTLEKAACRKLLEREMLLDARLKGSEAERAAAVWHQLRELLFEISALPDSAPWRELERIHRAAVRQDLMTRLDVVIIELARGNKESANA